MNQLNDPRTPHALSNATPHPDERNFQCPICGQLGCGEGDHCQHGNFAEHCSECAAAPPVAEGPAVNQESFENERREYLFTEGMKQADRRWVTALAPYLGGGIVPVWHNTDGTIDTIKTMENFAQLHKMKKIGPNGEDLEWPQ